MSEINDTKEITIWDVLRVIRKRITPIICIALIALILGASAGAVITLMSNATYGARSEFYVTSTGANNIILSLLRSDGFAEALLLDENGLPADKQGTEEYEQALALKENLANLKKEKEDAEDSLDLCPLLIANKQRTYTAAKEKYDSIKELLGDIYGGTASNATAIIEYKAKLDAAEQEMNTAKKEYDKALRDNEALEVKIDELTKSISNANSAVKRATTSILADARKDKSHIDAINRVKNSLTFTYAETTTSGNEKEQFNQSLLYVTVSVQFDQEFAEELVNKISLTLPGYVEDSIVPGKDEKAPECSFVSGAGTVSSVNYKNPLTQSVKYSLIALAAGLVIACGIFVIIDLFIKNPDSPTKSKKQLDPDDKPEITE